MLNAHDHSQRHRQVSSHVLAHHLQAWPHSAVILEAALAPGALPSIPVMPSTLTGECACADQGAVTDLRAVLRLTPGDLAAADALHKALATPAARARMKAGVERDIDMTVSQVQAHCNLSDSMCHTA